MGYHVNMDDIRFDAAVARAQLRMKNGIGMLAEKTLHSALKYYYEPDVELHEVAVDGFFADALNDEGIMEIQTASLFSLMKKLPGYLEDRRVTVVHPIIRNRWIIWVNPNTGEASKKRKSPKVGIIPDAFQELIYIRSVLTHERLRIILPLIDVEEYRLLDGWSKNRKSGSTKVDRIPILLADEMILEKPDDYLGFIPDDLPDSFTVKELAVAAGLRPATASAMARTLFDMGLLSRSDKRGNSYLYSRYGQ